MSEVRENIDIKSVSEEVKIIKRSNKVVCSKGYGVDNGFYWYVSGSENLDVFGYVE